MGEVGIVGKRVLNMFEGDIEVHENKVSEAPNSLSKRDRGLDSTLSPLTKPLLPLVPVAFKYISQQAAKSSCTHGRRGCATIGASG